MKTIITAVLVFGFSSAFAADGGAGPCQQIKQACETAGFVKGQAKEGTGLWVDCIDPLMRGTAQPKKAKKALPTVDSATVAACKAKHPNFGEGKQAKK